MPHFVIWNTAWPRIPIQAAVASNPITRVALGRADRKNSIRNSYRCRSQTYGLGAADTRLLRYRPRWSETSQFKNVRAILLCGDGRVTCVDLSMSLRRCRLRPRAREVKQRLPLFVALRVTDRTNGFLRVLPKLVWHRHDTSPMCPIHSQGALLSTGESGQNRSLSNQAAVCWNALRST
jgi:hypothetical protein